MLPFSEFTMQSAAQFADAWPPGAIIHSDCTFGSLRVSCTQRDSVFLLEYDDWVVRIHSMPAGIDVIRHGTLPEFYFNERIAVPFSRLLGGAVLLHAGSVATSSGAVVMLAKSGTGKSTLTAAAVALSGAGLVSDDMVALCPYNGHIYAIPDARHIAMRHSVFSAEHFVTDIVQILGKSILRVGSEFCLDHPVPVAAVLVLSKGDRLSVQNLPVSDAVTPVLEQQLMISNPVSDFRRYQFRALMQVVGQTPIYRVTVNLDDGDGIKRVIDCLAGQGILGH